MKCSRNVPKPMKVWAKRAGSKERLRYVIYPRLDAFKLACKKCRFRTREANRYQCVLRDPDFDLKYYGMAVGLNGKLWVGTVPPTLRSRNPKLYAEAVAFVSGRARSLTARVYSGPEVDTEGQTKPSLTAGIDSGLARLWSKPGRSAGIGIAGSPGEDSKNTSSLTLGTIDG